MLSEAAAQAVRPDELLALVIRQAQALDIPVSTRISPQVRLNARAKRRFGCCMGTRRAGFVIELAAALPQAGRGACLQTLAHEVLHTCPGCQDHGPRWQQYAARMNAAYGYAIHRVDTPQALGLPPPAAPQWRWQVVCTVCGRQYLRQRASALVRQPQRYRCGRCGGRLRAAPLPSPEALSAPQPPAPEGTTAAPPAKRL